MTSTDTRMLTALVRLRGALQAAPLPLDVAGAEELRVVRAELIAQLEDYVIPRVMTTEAPLLVVVGGSTGAGKSTLVNSVVGHRVTQPGVLRPTTRSAVLVHHPEDGHWFGQERLLPELRRVSEPTTEHDALQLVASDRLPQGLAILDAPDVDSVERANRNLAVQLLAAADLWLFVTSAARYADQVPWEHLKDAAARSTAVAIVLDRTAPDAVSSVSTHLARMMASRGLKDSPLFVVNEGEVTPEGLLAGDQVSDIRGWLESLAQDADARGAVVNQTLGGTIRSLTRRVHPVADAAAAQFRAAADLRAAADAAYATVIAELPVAATDGTLVRGEIQARWQAFVGSGDLLRSLEDKVGRLRERVVNAVKGKPQQAELVIVAVEAGLEALVQEHAEKAAWETAEAWRALPGGAGALVDTSLTRASRDLRRASEQAVRGWQGEVVELVRAAGAEKRATARFLAYGVQGLSVALMVVVLDGSAHSSAAAAGRELMAEVFGDDDTHRMQEIARAGLTSRLAGLLDADRARFMQLLDDLAISEQAPEQVRQATRRVDDVRFAAVKQHPGPAH